MGDGAVLPWSAMILFVALGGVILLLCVFAPELAKLIRRRRAARDRASRR